MFGGLFLGENGNFGILEKSSLAIFVHCFELELFSIHVQVHWPLNFVTRVKERWLGQVRYWNEFLPWSRFLQKLVFAIFVKSRPANFVESYELDLVSMHFQVHWPLYFVTWVEEKWLGQVRYWNEFLPRSRFLKIVIFGQKWPFLVQTALSSRGPGMR